MARSSRNLASEVTCTICLEQVIDDNSKAVAKLKCGHIFHLSCVGCEFNFRGVMQCPNCRMIEDSEWLYTDFENGENIIMEETNDMHAVNCPLDCPCPCHGGYGDHVPEVAARRAEAADVGANGNDEQLMPNVHIHPHQHTYIAADMDPINLVDSPVDLFDWYVNRHQTHGIVPAVTNVPANQVANGQRAMRVVLALPVRDPNSRANMEPTTSVGSENVVSEDDLELTLGPPSDPLELRLQTGGHWPPSDRV